MGIITSLGESVDPFWDRLINGESGIGPITSFDSSDYEVHFGGECVDFRAEDYIDRREIKRLDRFAQLAIGAACNCHKDSGLDLDKEDPSRVGVIVGSGIGGLLEIEQQHKRLLNKGPSKVSAFTIPKLMANAGGGNISIMFNAQGPCTTVVTACASASHAMGDALTTIQRDEADIIFTGGAEAAVTPLGIAAFAAMKALSLRNDEPQRASRPFDRDRDGVVFKRELLSDKAMCGALRCRMTFDFRAIVQPGTVSPDRDREHRLGAFFIGLNNRCDPFEESSVFDDFERVPEAALLDSGELVPKDGGYAFSKLPNVECASPDWVKTVELHSQCAPMNASERG